MRRAARTSAGRTRARAARPARRPGPVPPLTPGMAAGAAFEAGFAALVAQLNDGVRAFLESGAPEPVHRCRVAERRIRALLDAYRDITDRAAARRLARELKWLHRRFGPVRDLDVFRVETVAPLRAAKADPVALSELAAAVAAARAGAAEKAAAAVESERYARLARKLARWSHGAWRAHARGKPEAPVARLAAASLARADRRVRKAMRRARGQRGAAQHAVRIEVKKLRYAVQFFATAFPNRRAATYLRGVTRLQDDFGIVQDAEAAALLAKRLARGGGAHLRKAARLVAEFEERRGARAMKRAQRLAKSFRAAKTFWTRA